MRRSLALTVFALGAMTTGLVAACIDFGDLGGGSTPASDAGSDATSSEAAAGFSLTAPASISIVPGGTASLALTLTRGDVSGAVNLGVTNLPQGVSASPTIIAADSSTATMTISAGSTASQGATTITVSAAAASGESTSTQLDLVVQGPPGSLDTSFGTNGITSVNASEPDGGVSGSGAAAVAIQSDGQIVVVGPTGTGATPTSDFAVRRFSADGKLDASFGTGGLTTIDFTPYDYAESVAITSAGQILVAGETDIDGTTGIARLTTSGTLDTSFAGGTGKLTIAADFEHRLTIDSAGDMIVPGDNFHTVSTSRVNASGVLQSGPTNFIAPGAAYTYGYAQEARADGTSYLGAESNLATDGGFDLHDQIIAFDMNGALVGSFGTGGVAAPAPLPGFSILPTVLRVTSDGKIAVLASASQGATFDLAFLRVTQTGAIDVPWQRNDFGGAEEPGGMAEDAAGRFVITARKDSDCLIARYTASGTLDTTFGSGGSVTLTRGTRCIPSDVAIDSVGRIVVVGSDGQDDWLVMRYWP